VQKSMEVVMISPESLVFSRSKGNNLLFSWMIAFNSLSQITSIVKESRNMAFQFPLLNFLSQYLNNELPNIKDYEIITFISEILTKKAKEEHDKFTCLSQTFQFELHTFSSKFLAVPTNCEGDGCFQEIFEFFGNCSEHGEVVLCMDCSQKHINNCYFKKTS